jgi:two-component system, NarL family, nitrate/nitrite response regulator NarL
MITRSGAAVQIKVLIVSDVRLHREGLALLLRGCPSIQVLGATTVEETRGALLSTPTDVALMDDKSPGDSNIAPALREVYPPLRILALGIRETPSEVLACAASGIDGYVPKDAALGDMVTAIEGVVRGELSCSPKMAASLYQYIGFSQAASTGPLTLRELQVADLLNRGFPNKEIARQLGVQPCTAKNHVKNILQKLEVHRRGQAAAKLRSLMGEPFRFG